MKPAHNKGSLLHDIWISLCQKNDNVMLAVKDNGKGYDSRMKTNGMGLNNITSRVKVFGGTLHIKTALQKGCFLRVTSPVVTSEEEQPV
jgi:signal transduction histidine kinase